MASPLDLIDARTFGLFDYRHVHSYALIRGFPRIADDEVGAVPAVLDLLFGDVTRISCWRDFSPLHLRYASARELAELGKRIGAWRPLKNVYLFEADSIESYVIASDVVSAEFQLSGSAPSPLVSDDPEYVAAHPPLKGVHRY